MSRQIRTIIRIRIIAFLHKKKIYFIYVFYVFKIIQYTKNNVEFCVPFPFFSMLTAKSKLLCISM